MPDISFIHESPFYELAALLVLTIIVGFFGLLMRPRRLSDVSVRLQKG